MKTFLVTTLFFLVPMFASAQIPDFPMVFWGTATIDEEMASSGTIIRAYYGSTLAGSVTVQETGVYGHTEPTKQKLVIGEGVGEINFTVQTVGGSETSGISPITHVQFVSGETVEKNLVFVTKIQTDAPVVETPSRSRGGGGGGGSSRSVGQVLGVQTGSLTDSQIRSILDLVRAFGADAAILVSVEAALNGSATTKASSALAPTFARDLQLGSVGEDVRSLQKLLNSLGYIVAASGPGSLGNETTIFGSATRAALIRFQQTEGIVPAVGYCGPKTRAVLNIKV